MLDSVKVCKNLNSIFNCFLHSGISKMTQKDITFVADFLTEHFNEVGHLCRFGAFVLSKESSRTCAPSYSEVVWGKRFPLTEEANTDGLSRASPRPPNNGSGRSSAAPLPNEVPTSVSNVLAQQAPPLNISSSSLFRTSFCNPEGKRGS